VLEARIPANLRHPDGLWFGISQRARVILLSKDVPADHATTYADLASDTIDGGLLVRSSSNIYNQSLVASFLASYDEADVEAWAEGVVDNMARKPQGGDRDQIRAVAAGEGEVALVNHYYFARMLAGDDDADREAASKLRLVWPDQDGRGVHVNISGAGILKNAPNRENAVKFLEFLTTPEAQELWALANYEYPVIDDPSLELPEVLRSFGEFKADTLNAAKLGELNRDAVRLMDRVRWR
jgi:iron(III) transport system substrate-binding protein